MPDQRVCEDSTQRPLVARNRVHGVCKRIEEIVVQLLERLLDPVILQVVIAEQPHPLCVVGRETACTRVCGADGRRRGPAGQPARLHGVDDPAP